MHRVKRKFVPGPLARGPIKFPAAPMGTTCVRPFSLSPFFSCPPGGGGILPARALRKSARPVALRMSRTAVVVIGLRALENSGRCSRYRYLEKEIARNRRFPRVSRRAETSIFLPRENARVIYRVSRVVRVCFDDWRTPRWITIAVLIFFSVRCIKFSCFLFVNHFLFFCNISFPLK